MNHPPADTPGNRLVIELLKQRGRGEITRHELHTRLPFNIPCPEDCDG